MKPRLGKGEYSWTGQFTTELAPSDSLDVVNAVGVPSDVLEEAILEFTSSTPVSSTNEEKLRKENEELWKLVNEQRVLQKRTYEKYKEATGSH